MVTIQQKPGDLLCRVQEAVGNESLVDWSDHCCRWNHSLPSVRHVKKSSPHPVTVADHYKWWADHGSVQATELDFVSVHTYAQWDGKDIAEAMPCIIANLQEVRNALPQSRLAITEAGWATIATEFGSQASEEKQRRYYHDLYDRTREMNITTLFIEAFDEDWKGNPNNPWAQRSTGDFSPLSANPSGPCAICHPRIKQDPDPFAAGVN